MRSNEIKLTDKEVAEYILRTAIKDAMVFSAEDRANHDEFLERHANRIMAAIFQPHHWWAIKTYISDLNQAA